MDDPTSQVLAQWMPYLLSAFLTVATAVLGAAGVLLRKLWTGGSHYAEKAWQLAERAVNKHLEFTDSLSASLNAQTELLAEIKEETARATSVIDQLGSDPTGSGEIKTLVELVKTKQGGCNFKQEELEKALKLVLKVARERQQQRKQQDQREREQQT
jgi:hypothetical protein